MAQEDQKMQLDSEAIFKFMLGFASIAAAVSVLLSASGFLVLRANAFLLGVSPSLLHYSVDDYLYEGTAFVAWWVTSIVTNPYAWGIFAVFPLFLLTKRSRQFSKILRKLNLNHRPFLSWGCIVFAALLLFGLIALQLPSPQAKDLLLSTDASQEIEKRASEAGLEKLESRYQWNLLYILLSVLILLGIVKHHREVGPTLNDDSTLPIPQREKRQQRTDRVFTGGCYFLYLLLTLQLILLPINYGQSVYTNAFHKVELVLDTKLENQAKLKDDRLKSKNVWLLKETSDAFILYFDGSAKSVHIIQKAQVTDLTLTEWDNIFAGIE